MASVTALASAFRRDRFRWLFVTLLATIAAHPVLQILAPGTDPLEGLLVLNLAVALFSVEGAHRYRFPLAILGLFAAARLAERAAGVGALFSFGDAVWVTACLVAVWLTVRRSLRAGPVDAERIFAALDAYLLAGIVFGVIFWMLERAVPGSFGPSPGGAVSRPIAFYLSFCSLTTMGFTDIGPQNALARSLVTIEAVGGAMYMTVLVARLVSLYSSERPAMEAASHEERDRGAK